MPIARSRVELASSSSAHSAISISNQSLRSVITLPT